MIYLFMTWAALLGGVIGYEAGRRSVEVPMRFQLEQACPTQFRADKTKLIADYIADDGACHYVIRPEWWR